MVFCSLLAYDLHDPRRNWSNRCLENLQCQLNNYDIFLKFELLERRWEECLIYKVKAIQTALEIKEDFVCLVDTDILFRNGWVKALKEFLQPYDPKEPIVAALPEWTADETYDFNDETVIYRLIDWGGLPILQPRFYLNAGIVVLSIGAKSFVKDWLEWTLKANGLHEQSAICYILHQREDINVIFLPDSLHYIPPFLPDFEVVIPAKALAIHAIGSVRNWMWERLVEGEFEVVGSKIVEADKWRAKRRYERAISTYQEAIAVGENLARAYLGIGACYLALRQFERAITAYHQALSLRPNYPEALRQLGECFELQGNYTAAFDCYRQVMRLEPKNWNKAKIGSLLRRLIRETPDMQRGRGAKVLDSWFV